MLQFDEYKVKLNNLRPGLDELEQALGLEAAQREVDMLESESASDGFWDNLEKAQKVQQRLCGGASAIYVESWRGRPNAAPSGTISWRCVRWAMNLRTNP